jgi:hypothetical protein
MMIGVVMAVVVAIIGSMVASVREVHPTGRKIDGLFYIKHLR